MKRNTRHRDTVFVRPSRAKATYLLIQWVGLSGTNFYIPVRIESHAQELFDLLIRCEYVEGISLYVRGKFAGARDGAGS